MANSTIRSIFYAGAKAVADAETPEPLVDAPLLVDSVRIDAEPSNVGEVLLGVVDSVSGDPVFTLSLPFVISAVPGKKIDLAELLVQVAEDGDGVTYLALN